MRGPLTSANALHLRASLTPLDRLIGSSAAGLGVVSLQTRRSGASVSHTWSIHMKPRIGMWLFVLFTPIIAAVSLVIGAGARESIGGRLLQVLGGTLGLVWTTALFLILGATVTRLFNLRGRGTDETSRLESETPQPPRPSANHPNRRRAA